MKNRKSKPLVCPVPPAAVFTVREARAQFSEALRRAEAGEEVTITSHGKSVAVIGKSAAGRPFVVDWKRLQTARPGGRGTDATALIRADRDGRA